MSHKPGIRNFPPPLTICEPAGALTFLHGPMTTIRSCSITTVVPGCGGLPVASITVTRLMTSGPAQANGLMRIDTKTQSACSRFIDTLQAEHMMFHEFSVRRKTGEL